MLSAVQLALVDRGGSLLVHLLYTICNSVPDAHLHHILPLLCLPITLHPAIIAYTTPLPSSFSSSSSQQRIT